MELEAESITLLVLHGLHLTGLAFGGNYESARDLGNLVIVALPYDLSIGSTCENGPSAIDQFD